jgi:preprotein translocase subunit SecE
VEEVLSTLQQARRAQGNEVSVTTEATRPNLIHRTIAFYHDVIAEMKKVTWPDWPQVRQLAIGVIALSLFIGGLIWLMDVVFQAILVRGIPSLFRS